MEIISLAQIIFIREMQVGIVFKHNRSTLSNVSKRMSDNLIYTK